MVNHQQEVRWWQCRRSSFMREASENVTVLQREANIVDHHCKMKKAKLLQVSLVEKCSSNRIAVLGILRNARPRPPNDR